MPNLEIADGDVAVGQWEASSAKIAMNGTPMKQSHHGKVGAELAVHWQRKD
jgi:hypothetical protein